MSLCLTYAVVKLEYFHTLMSLCFALEAMLIKSELTVGHILLRLEKDVEEGRLEARGTSKHKSGGSLSGQDVRVLVCSDL